MDMMLTRPVDMQTRIVGIDPGTTSMGVCFGVTDYHTPRFVVKSAFTVDVAHITHNRQCDLLEFGSRDIAMCEAIRTFLTGYLNQVHPDVLVSEVPYLNSRFPLSYMLLSKCVQAIQEAGLGYSWALPFRPIEPSRVKPLVGVSGKDGDKNNMYNAVINHPEIHFEFDPTGLDEHSIDATVIAYSAYVDVRDHIRQGAIHEPAHILGNP